MKQEVTLAGANALLATLAEEGVNLCFINFVAIELDAVQSFSFEKCSDGSFLLDLQENVCTRQRPVERQARCHAAASARGLCQRHRQPAPHRLKTALVNVLGTPDNESKMAERGVVTVGSSTNDFRVRRMSETKKSLRVARVSGIALD